MDIDFIDNYSIVFSALGSSDHKLLRLRIKPTPIKAQCT